MILGVQDTSTWEEENAVDIFLLALSRTLPTTLLGEIAASDSRLKAEENRLHRKGMTVLKGGCWWSSSSGKYWILR